MLHAKTSVHHRSTITIPRPVAPSALSAEPSRVPAASSAMAKHGIGFSVAEILDVANFKRPFGSSAKDADREPAATAVAVAGHLGRV